MSSEITSKNFAFMRDYEPQFDRLGALAERYFSDDPNTCMIKLRQFGELLAQEVAARTGLYRTRESALIPVAGGETFVSGENYAIKPFTTIPGDRHVRLLAHSETQSILGDRWSSGKKLII